MRGSDESKVKETNRVDKHERVGEGLEHGLETVTDLLVSGNTGGVDVVDAGADLVGVTVLLEGVQELEVALRRLDGDDVSVKALDGGEDVVKVGVAEVRVGLESIGDAGGGELERVNGPLEVVVPVNAAERKTLTDGGLIDLDGVDAGLLEIDDLVAESKSELLGLELTGDIRARERPVEDGNRSSQHTLHWALRDALGVATPLDGDRTRTADVRNDDGRTNVATNQELSMVDGFTSRKFTNREP